MYNTGTSLFLFSLYGLTVTCMISVRKEAWEVKENEEKE